MFDDFDYLSDGMLGAILFFGLLALMVTIFYLLALQRALQAVSEENRKMAPGQVWLLLIPIFNFIWLFFVVIRIADSFRDEFARLNIPFREERPSYGIGLPYAILNVCSLLPFLGTFLGAFISIAAFICWIMYWVKVVECRKLVEANQHNGILDAERGIFHQQGNPNDTQISEQ